MNFQIGDIVLIKGDITKDLWIIEEFTEDNPEIVMLKGRTNRSIIYIPKDQLIQATSKMIDEITHRCDEDYVQFRSEILRQRAIRTSANAQNQQSYSAGSVETIKAVPTIGSFNPNSKPINLDSTQSDKVKGSKENLIFEKPGTILHIDTDKEYLERCLQKYKELSIPHAGYYMDASEFPSKIRQLLEKEQPDILVITGHDRLIDNKKPFALESYLNSKYFAEAVTEARKFDRNKNNLIIFAGACSSYFEALMEAGANFASSPMRITIADLDPAKIAITISVTPALSMVDTLKAINFTRGGTSGIGGIDTEGTLKNAIPNTKYASPSDKKVLDATAITVGFLSENDRNLSKSLPCKSCPYYSICQFKK